MFQSHSSFSLALKFGSPLRHHFLTQGFLSILYDDCLLIQASLQALNLFNYKFPVVYPSLGALTTVKTAVEIPYLKHYIFCFDIFQVCVLLDYHFFASCNSSVSQDLLEQFQASNLTCGE